MNSSVGQLAKSNSSDIAVIGMSCRVPGANSVDQFWENLKAGRESVVLLTDDDLRAEEIPPPIRNDPQYVKVAAPLLEDSALFDAEFFGFTPREAELLDPQQRIFLEIAWEALEGAGYDPHSYRGMVGVYAGVGQSAYFLRLLSNEALIDSLGGRSALLTADKDFLATYVSYKLNLRGPSVTVQTACSTSLVAVHMACQALLMGECDMALAGGATVHIPQRQGYLFQEGNILSPDGHCRAFDIKAQGTFAGNGAGVVLLKRCEEAVAHGDHIHALIKGSAINNDGAEKIGLTAPSIHGQRRVVRAAQAVAGVSAETISYVEAHGTGTPLGDPVEITALTEAFRATTRKKAFCAIGSVKTNIGHLNTAAGVVGLIKTVLALQHRQIPASLHFETPNPKIDFENSPFYVNKDLREWTGTSPLRAGVSSLGMGGTNAHVIVEEAPARSPCGPSMPVQLILLSARTEAALARSRNNLSQFLRQQDGVCLADVAYTLQIGRKGFRYRNAIVCQKQQDAIQALDQTESNHWIEGIAPEEGREVVFLFPGQGSQSVHMGREVYGTEPVFRDTVNECCEWLRPALGFDLREILYPAPDFEKEAEKQLNETAVTQPALFIIEYALATQWIKWGVRPRAMIGHSLGEYVAACIAGVMNKEEALRLVAARGRLMQEMPPGGMLAVAASPADLEPRLGRELSIAAINSHDQCVASGTCDAVQELEEQLKAEEIACHRLDTSHAFHSHLMDPILERFALAVGQVKLKPPTSPFISNLTGTWITEREATDIAYWVRHLRQQVKFAQGIDLLLRDVRNPLFLEVGPGQTLSRLISRNPNCAGATVLHLLGQSQSDPPPLMENLGRLWAMGASVDWNKFHAGDKRRRVPLPVYPFEKKRHWIDAPPVGSGSQGDSEVVEKKADIGDWFYTPLWKQSLPLPPAGDREALNWLMLLGDEDIGLEFANRLVRLGHTVVKVRTGANFLRVGDAEYRIDPKRREDYQALLGVLYEQRRTPQKIVHLWNLRAGSTIETSQSVQESIDTGFYSLVFIAQALASYDTPRPVELLVVTNNIHMVTGEEDIDAAKAMISGPCQVIPQEYPNVSCRCIDLMLATGEHRRHDQLEYLANELLGSSPERIVAFRGGRRWIRNFERLPLQSSQASPCLLRSKGVYLVTGGLGNIGLELTEFLARSVQARMVLVGRSVFPPEQHWEKFLASADSDDAICRKVRRLQRLKQLGAEFLVVSADIGDFHQMQAVFRCAQERFGPFNGVFHTAGLANQSPALLHHAEKADCELFFHAKVNGSLVLEKLLQEKPADFCVLFSSLSSILGGLGLCAYSAANLFMDAFANQHHRSDSCAWIAVNWDGWNFSGHATGVPAESTLALSMSPREGMAALERILHAPPLPQIIVSAGNLDARFKKWVQAELPVLHDTQPSIPETRDLSNASLDMSYVAPASELEVLVVRVLEELLGIERIGIHDNFFQLGANSLTVVQIASRLNRQFKKTVPLNIIFDNPTAAGLSSAISSATADVQKGEAPALTNEISAPPLVSRRSRKSETVELENN